jgi:iron(III) transport system substrate-binding protein
MTGPQGLGDRKIDRRTMLGYLAIGGTGIFVACTTGASPGAPAPSAGATGSPAAGAARWGMTSAEDAAWKAIEAAALKEGKLTLYSVGSVPPTQLPKLKSEFAKDYPGIEIENLAVGNSAQLTARVTTEQDGKLYVGDVADHSVRSALLLTAPPTVYYEGFVPPAAKDPAVRWLVNPLADPTHTGKVTAAFAQNYAIWTNTNLVKAADLPKNIMDVASNPKWKGQIIMRTPWTSGGGTHLYYFAKKVYGQDWVTKMQAQNATFSEDQDAALLQVARGEFAIGLAMTGRQGAEFIKAGQPLRAVWPDDFVITSTQGNQLIVKAPHPNAAKVFINWNITERGQQFWRDLGQFPLNAAIAPAEDWMKGITATKTVYENLQDAKEQAASNDAAMKEFKR